MCHNFLTCFLVEGIEVMPVFQGHSVLALCCLSLIYMFFEIQVFTPHVYSQRKQ